MFNTVIKKSIIIKYLQTKWIGLIKQDTIMLFVVITAEFAYNIIDKTHNYTH